MPLSNLCLLGRTQKLFNIHFADNLHTAMSIHLKNLVVEWRQETLNCH